MFDWLPVTILGIATLPFLLGLATFAFWWWAFTYETGYRYSYKRKRYIVVAPDSGSFLWGLVATAFTVWFIYSLMGGFSWDKFNVFWPLALSFAWKWLAYSCWWPIVRWAVQANRGRRGFDQDRDELAHRKSKGDVSKLNNADLYDLSENLPTAKEYTWNVLWWWIFWPVSMADTFLRDAIRIIWEDVIYRLLTGSLDWIARKIYGKRYMAQKPSDYDSIREAEAKAEENRQTALEAKRAVERQVLQDRGRRI